LQSRRARSDAPNLANRYVGSFLELESWTLFILHFPSSIFAIFFFVRPVSPRLALMFKAADLFDLAQTEHAVLFDGCNHAWEALKKIEPYLTKVTKQNPPPRFPGATIGERVIIGEGTVVEPGAMIKGPAVIGKNCQIRHNAYIRENVIVGDNCVVGNSSELKNALLFNGCQVPHFNYIGDSILGYKAHTGAGVICSTSNPCQAM